MVPRIGMAGEEAGGERRRKELRGARETEGERGFSILLDPAKACPPP